LFAAGRSLYRRRVVYQLYNAPQSTCSQRVRFVLNAKGLRFDEVKLDLLEGDQLKPEYLRLNPNGVVPTLVHDGAVVIDSAVIMEYLEEVEPPSFTPAAPAQRAAMRSHMRFIDEMPTPAVRVPTFNIAFLPRFQAMSEEEFVGFANSKPLRKEMMLRMGQKGFSDADMKEALDRLQRTIARMDDAIAATGGPWLMGKQLTLADIAVMPVIVRLADLRLDAMWKDRPAVARWYAAIQAQPAFAPTYYFGSLLTEKFPWLKEKLARSN
jgi:glutathione S-transferase